MELAPGVRIGELRLSAPIGAGAMGSVWEAVREGGDRVAVKIADRHLLRDATDRARFDREARLVQKLESPHVARTLGRGMTEDGRPYIVMELLKGETLSERLRRERILGRSTLVAIFEQVADALDEAHAAGIVHRDIKPENIFLTKTQGGAPFVKVLDFGIAKRTGVPNPSVVTEAGTTVGTPDYMSPEQLRFARDIDHRADLWALGVIAYRALLGKLPFEATTFAGLCMRITAGKFERPGELDPSLPPDLDRWFGRALAVDREDRYTTARDTVDGLRDALGLATGRPGAPSWYGTAVAVLVGILALALGVLAATMDGL
jgi:serine/threonine-protein kinase